MFPLLRYFSITSLLVMSIATISLWELYRHTSLEDLVAAEESRNVALATSLANGLWENAKPLIKQASQDPQALREHPMYIFLHNSVESQIAGQSIIKVKIYALNGITIFSTDPEQIGNDKSGSSGFIRAHDGEVVSELVHKDSIYSLEGVLSERDLITSYVPVLDQEGRIEGVLELYSDITEYLQRVNRTQWILATGLFVFFIALYALLFIIVLRASRTLKSQEIERLIYQDEITHQANHDQLTNLPNRSMMDEHLTHTLPRAKRNKTLIAVMFLDLDGFKAINDNLGHHAGDLLLKTVADRLTKSVRGSDLVCRLGGDEFTVVLGDVNDIEEITICAERIVCSIAEPYILEGIQASVTTSVGISIYPLDSEDINHVLANADAAMYAAKDEGKNQFRLYDTPLDKRNREKKLLRDELRHALEREQFEIYYQPKLNFQTGHVSGVEALLRWNHPEMGLLQPAMFLSMLEDSGLMRSVGSWVIEESCQQLKAWQEKGLRKINLSINLSLRQFADQSFANHIQGIVQRYDILAQHLEFEVTENILLKDDKNSLKILYDLKEIGVKIAIDDFGVGFSSLTYLRRFPIDTIKIDQSFVQTMLVDKENSAIVTAVLALAHGMNLQIIAEGVETEEQYAYLHALRCHEMQGYLFSPPLPANQFEELLAEDEALILTRPLPKTVKNE